MTAAAASTAFATIQPGRTAVHRYGGVLAAMAVRVPLPRPRETVHRSALTLKLLTYAPTGTIVAAPTTSLPEQIGGERNWDYRYLWIRDAAFCVYALLRLGFAGEAEAFIAFLAKHVTRRGGGPSGPLQIMYGIDGRTELPEAELTQLEGYQASAPVRTGPDGLRGEEGTFSICSFWYVEALTRAGRLDEARLAFEKMLTYANHLGLYAEQISRPGEQQGNFPQAFTHLALISAAFNLDRAHG